MKPAGGSLIENDLVWGALRAARREKPVTASFAPGWFHNIRDMNTRKVPCGRDIQAEVEVWQHEEKCVQCLRIERDRYKAALEKIMQGVTSPPKLTTVDAGKCVCGLPLACQSGIHDTRQS